uniref:Uncharacterized protein n=1 Tax=Trypanosoma congolense (strain IL3000) TaxID=1068625 RepID=F9W3N0_TRYCI|nr:hypothetical protein, conserved [Trypanosoma congolense IL3000]
MDTCEVTCSWGTPTPPIAICDSAEAARDHATATSQREANAARPQGGDGVEGCSSHSELPSQAVTLSGGKAPWIELQSRERVTHIAIVGNARVLEVHTKGGDVQTHEGVSVEGGVHSLGRYIHSVDCRVAPGERALLKFFARRPKDVIQVVALCVSTVKELPESAPTAAGDGSRGENGLPASCSTPELAIEERLRQLEATVQVLTFTMVRRLNEVEMRLGALEQRASG